MTQQFRSAVSTREKWHLSVAALFIIAQEWQPLKCPSVDGWTNEMCYIHMEEYYRAVKRNEVQIHPTTWKNLENMLSDRCQLQKNTHRMIPVIPKSRIGKSIDSNSRLFFAEGWRRVDDSSGVGKGLFFFFWGDKNVLNGLWDGRRTLWMHCTLWVGKLCRGVLKSFF